MFIVLHVRTWGLDQQLEKHGMLSPCFIFQCQSNIQCPQRPAREPHGKLCQTLETCNHTQFTYTVI